MLQNAEVILSIAITGMQAQRGSYEHMVTIGSDGKEINSVITEQRPLYHNCTKSIKLSNEFVKDALLNVPPELDISPRRWNGFSEEKRINMAVHAYVNSVSPDNRYYKYELIR